MVGDTGYIIGFVGGLSVEILYDIILLVLTTDTIQNKKIVCIAKHKQRNYKDVKVSIKSVYHEMFLKFHTCNSVLMCELNIRMRDYNVFYI